MSLILSTFYRFDEFELHSQKRALLRDGQPVLLSPKAFEVLLCLVQHSGEVVTKDHLLKTVWPESFVEEGNLAQQIFSLRKALADRSTYIVTIPRRGYQFVGSVQMVQNPFASGIAPAIVADRAFGTHIERVRERTRIVVEDSGPPARRPHYNKMLAYSVVGVAVVALSVWLGWRWIDRTVPGDHHEIVLADFENTTGDPEFERALNLALAADLRQSPYLLVASAAKRQETLKLMERSPQETLSPSLAREVCQRIGDQAVLTPLLARLGRKYLVTLTATDCESGDDLMLTKAVADDRDSILGAIDTLAAAMRRRLGEPLSTLRSMNTPLLAKKTNSLDALKAYSLAHDLGAQGKYEDAIPLLQKAIELDPNFAIAYSDLGTIYSNVGEHDLMVDALTKAYELRDYAIPQDKLSIVSIYHSNVTGDIDEGIRNYQTWAGLYPRSFAPRVNLSNLEVQIGRADLAIEPGQQAVELGPTETNAYVVLGRAQMHASQLQQAKVTCQKAIQLKVDDSAIHGLLLEIAVAERNPLDVEAQVAWAKDKPAEPFILSQKMVAEYAAGRPGNAEALVAEMAERYRRQGLNERADRMLGATPRMEVDLGRFDEARRRLHALPPLEGSTDIPVALALVGETAQAETIYRHESQLHPHDTLWQYSRLPQIQAAIAISQNKPQEAIQVLERASPYDLRTYDLPALRGAACLAARQPALAEIEFHKIIDNPGLEPLSPNATLAHLGLARALAQQQNVAASRLEYETFFSFWRDAQPDLPVLIQAHAEYARLPSQP